MVYYSYRLEELREDNNLKRIDVAKIIGVNRSVYGRYEKEHQIIPLKHLNTLCNYFNVSLDYIFNFINVKNYKCINTNINTGIVGKRLKEFRKKKNIT